MTKHSVRAKWNTANAKKANEPFTADKIFGIQPPTKINGVKVLPLTGSEQEFKGETWITLIPTDEEDVRIWEFSRTTGRIIQTK
jgi:hypothetical protein